MDNSNSESTNPRNPDYYKDRYPDRLTPVVKTAADEITIAVSKELLSKNSGYGKIDLFTPSDQPPAVFNVQPIYVGISSFRYLKRKDWMFDGSKKTPEELNQIEDAFESFINDVEWADD
jgi:hypothetical protein